MTFIDGSMFGYEKSSEQCLEWNNNFLFL